MEGSRPVGDLVDEGLPADQFKALCAAATRPSRVIRLMVGASEPDLSTTASAARQAQFRQPCTFIKSGSTSSVFALGKLAVKFNIASQLAHQVILRSATAFEVDAAAVAYMLTAGSAAHVMRPFGTLSFTLEAPVFTTVRDCCVDGLVTELIEGVLLNDGVSRARDLGEFITAGLKGTLVFDGHDAFPDALRALIFQVVFTIASWLRASANGFRHNDLHVSNVCVSYWRADRAPVSVRYNFVDPSGVTRTFEVRSAFRAVIVDFEFAALLPRAGGVPFDRRFYPAAKLTLQAAGSGVFETTFAEHGISHVQPSAHYDVCFFAYSCYSQLMTDADHACTLEFVASYRQHFRNFHRKSALTFGNSGTGRLLPRAQVALAQAASAGEVPQLPCPATWMCSAVYFAPFRTASPEGIAPEPLHVDLNPANVVAGLRSTCTLAKSTHAWRPRLDKLGRLVSYPLAGTWVALSATWAAIRTALPPGRQMTRAEMDDWVRTGITAPPVQVAEEMLFDRLAPPPVPSATAHHPKPRQKRARSPKNAPSDACVA
jgi:hypothetical protein